MKTLLRSITPRQWLRYVLFSAGYGLSFLLLFTTSEAISPLFTTKATLAVLTLLCAILFCLSQHYAPMEKYRSKGSAVYLSILSIYSSLATFGQRFFLNGNTRIHYDSTGAGYCMLGAIWYLPILWLFLCSLEFFSANRTPRQPNTPLRRKRSRQMLACFLMVEAVLLANFWPGFFPEDAMNQLRPALDLAPLDDWHPVLNSLLQKAILLVIPHPGAIVAVQMALFAWLVNKFLMLGWDFGLKFPLLLVLGIVFLLLPNQALSFSNAMKDYPFTLALLWGTYLILQLLLKKPWTKKLSFYLCLISDLFLTACLRHNGMLPMGAVLVLCTFLSLKKGNVHWRKAAAACIAAVLAVGIFKGPVYTALNVIPNIQSPYTSMLCAVGSYINKDLELSQESQQIMETVIPLEDWADYYSRFAGHDTYYWERPAGSQEYDTSQIDLKKAFRVYLEALFKAPDVVLKDRLDGMDILWDVVMPDDSFNGNGFHYIHLFDDTDVGLSTEGMTVSATTPNGTQYVTQNPLSQAYFETTRWPHHGLANILLWRTGLYLIAFLALILFWWKNKMTTLWVASMPMLGNLAGTVLILYHQSFRYVYFVQLGVVAMIFATVALRNSLKQEN